MSPLGTDGLEGQDEIAALADPLVGSACWLAEQLARRRAEAERKVRNPFSGFGPARSGRDRLRLVVDNDAAAVLAGLEFVGDAR